MKTRRAIKRRKGQNKINSIIVVAVMVIFIVIVTVQINNLEDIKTEKDKELNIQNTQIEAEKERTEELESQRVYVQTKKYIEESAKDLGFVYPDELILKPIKD